jgi:carbonic anhydrase/acetyltransferase-like protein (isoleucine patch superfamily)
VPLSLEQFLGARRWALTAHVAWLRLALGVRLDWSVQASLSSRLRPARRGSISIGPETLIAFGVTIYTRDHVTGRDRPVRIGAHCFVGAASLVQPGVTIGDDCIVGAGSVVTEDVPPRCIVAGNPAQVIRRDIDVGPFGRLRTADPPSAGAAEP